MSGKKSSEFDTWFESKYGREPDHSQTLADLENAIADAESSLRWRKNRLAAKERWLGQLDAASCGWQAARAKRTK